MSISEIEGKINSFVPKFIELMDNFKLDKALEHTMNLSDSLNKYIDTLRPWTLTSEENKAELENILIRLLNGIYAVSMKLANCYAE